MTTKKELLTLPIQHIDIKQHNVVALVDAMQHMAFSSRDLYRAASIYERMLRDTDCGVILCLAGSMVSAGLKQVFIDLLRHNMVDAIVSTGANIVDQDFFEALGYKHWIADDLYKSGTQDNQLRELMIDRIYDTMINEEELRDCDAITGEIADSLIYAAYQLDVPIFCPAFSDCSAGFGLVMHQHKRGDKPKLSIDSAKDFYEITQLKIANRTTGLFMLGGGVPKNFAQDIVVAAEILTEDAPMHKYAIQVTVADVRDGALSSSTLKEASSWGKVDTTYEQMVYSEATLAVPLIAGYAYHKKAYEARKARRWAALLEPVTA